MVCLPRARSVMRHLRGIHKPIQKPTLPIGAHTFRDQRPVDWIGMVGVFFTRCRRPTPYHTTVCWPATGHVLYRTVFSFLVSHVAVLLAAPPSAH